MLAFDPDRHRLELLRVLAPRRAVLSHVEEMDRLSHDELLRLGAADGWEPAFDQLTPFSHWITPASVATRFDARFFVAELPRGQSALHDTIETSEGVWLAPARAIEADYHTLFPTTEHLKRLVLFRGVADLLAFAGTKPIRMVSPEVGERGDGLRIRIRPGE